MSIEFDPQKARNNLRKHGVSFGDAEQVLYDPFALTVEDPDSDAEQRFITLGMDTLGRVLVVVFTYRGDTIRMISARKASRTERERYDA